MSNTILSQSDIVETAIPEKVRERPEARPRDDASVDERIGAIVGARIAGLEAELRATHTEFARLREAIDQRDKKNAALMDAYKSVMADLSELFEAQREEYEKREASLRFFLNSIQARLKSDIRSEIAGARRWWPFGRSA